MYGIRQGAHQLSELSLGEWILSQFEQTPGFVGLNLMSTFPMLVLVTAADNLTRHATQRRRIAAFALAVVLARICPSG